MERNEPGYKMEEWEEYFRELLGVKKECYGVIEDGEEKRKDR